MSNAALLLFAKDPQRWFVSATVKCVQFYGTKVQKPMAFQQVYGGSVFEMVDQATAFAGKPCVPGWLYRASGNGYE